MKALTLHRPWPWAILYAGKRIENRSWRPPAAVIGQRIVIHAGKVYDEAAEEFICRIAGRGTDGRRCDEGIVGTAMVSHSISASPDPWFFGPVGWVLWDVRALPQPIPCRGAQGLWMVPADVAARIETGERSA